MDENNGYYPDAPFCYECDADYAYEPEYRPNPQDVKYETPEGQTHHQAHPISTLAQPFLRLLPGRGHDNTPSNPLPSAWQKVNDARRNTRMGYCLMLLRREGREKTRCPRVRGYLTLMREALNEIERRDLP